MQSQPVNPDELDPPQDFWGDKEERHDRPFNPSQNGPGGGSDRDKERTWEPPASPR